jgi:tetratricopeptide (TPR) repeat protein
MIDPTEPSVPTPTARWRAPEWDTLLPAFAPTLAALAFVMLAVLVMLIAPRLLARPPESFRAAPTPAFLWTRVEQARLESSALLKAGAPAAHLAPWREAPARGVGSTGYDPAKGALFNQALGQLRDAAAKALDASSLTSVLGGLGQGNQVAVLYHGALALYRGGDFEQAERRAEKTLDKIKSGRPGRDEAATVRLDGEEVATAYLLGHIRLKRGDVDGAIKAFDEALKTAKTARGYAAYRTVSDPLFALDPRYSLTDLSLADLWTDYLTALNRKDPEAARQAATELYDSPASVLAHPALAATLQVLAAEAGEPKLVAALDPDWSAIGQDPSLAKARALSAAAMLAMGDAGLMSELESSPERDLFAPWVPLARERQLVKSEIADTPDAGAPIGADAAGEQGRFLRLWRSEYLGRLGADFLERARDEHQPGYYGVILRSNVFPPLVAYGAAMRWWGLGPWSAALLIGLLCLLPVITAIGGLVYWETFRALHFDDRRHKLRKAAADPLAVLNEGGA